MSFNSETASGGVNAGKNSSLNYLPEVAMTIIAWIKLDTNTDGRSTIVGATGPSSNLGGYRFTVENDQLECLVSPTSPVWPNWYRISNTGLIIPNQWTFVALTWATADADPLEAYSGTLDSLVSIPSYDVDNSTTGTVKDDSAHDKWIGRLERGTGWGFYGGISRIAMYKGIRMTPMQLNHMMYQEDWNTLECRLFYDYDKWGVIGGPVRDLSGYGNDGSPLNIVIREPMSLSYHPPRILPISTIGRTAAIFRPGAE